ncbi:alginate O-acetyltransferase AlgF [Gilvimarinus sp. DA14]|uniref:alginate O-acetyltransferase AlgF n=1 Tax=Gilvimarinus sp. DA14 TaxID=2956798 RepID=UPI0020B7F6F0|nr:alginate O-acetyltransferase AlgF [Gilvimarinus sp. DA14]UTF59858.1 alginate O-acetyltransferase AlgF [Gilvimarinus sp. DA14]
MNIAMIRSLFLITLIGWVNVCAADENAALYDAAVPEDASFIRVVNTSDATVTVSVNGMSQVVAARQMGSYFILSEGDYSVDVAGMVANVSLATKQARTFVYDGEALNILTDKLPDTVKKAQIMFYNFTGESLSLKTDDGKFPVVENVAPGNVGFREVNEVKMPFKAFNGESPVQSFEALLLRKGQTYSYVLMQTGEGSLYSQAGANTVYMPQE